MSDDLNSSSDSHSIPAIDYASAASRFHLPSRENVGNFFKTLAWVAPLTILIWVYAEREQVTTDQPVTIPVAMKDANPNRVVRLLNADNNITAALTGPR